MFEQLTNRLQEVFDGLGRVGKLTEKDVDKAMREVRMALLEADVALPVVKDFVGRVKERAIGADVAKSLKPGQQVVKIVHEELLATLGEGAKLNFSGSTKPHVIMLVGLQGAGKTTTAAKLALELRRDGRAAVPDRGRYLPPRRRRSVGDARQADSSAVLRGRHQRQAAGHRRTRPQSRQRAERRRRHHRHGGSSANQRTADGRAGGDQAAHQPGGNPAGRQLDDRAGSGQHRAGLQRAARHHRADPDESRW